MNRIMAIVTISVCAILLSAGSVNANIPRIVNFQGLLTDDSEVPLDGAYTVTFRIYDAESGGSALWVETSDVTCEAGLFNATLGLVTPIDLSFSKQYWLSIQLSGDEEMAPRYELAAVPYAMWSAASDSALVAAVADSAAVAMTATVADEVDWSGIVDVPAGFADGEDNISPASGDGHSLNAADGDPLDIVYVDNDGNVEIGAGLGFPEVQSMRSITVGTDTIFGGYSFTVYGNGTGKRLMWDGAREAFRAGHATGDEWDPINLGFTSVATGYNTIARGQYSTAFGCYSDATANYSLAAGYGATASSIYSMALGHTAASSGMYGLAMGRSSIASGYGSTAIGHYVVASADSSIVIGHGVGFGSPLDNTTPRSLAIGFNTTAPTLFVGGPGHRVGIGTVSPAQKLDVAGTVEMNGFKMPTNAETGYVLVCTDSSGTGAWAPNLATSDGDWVLSGSDIYSAVAGKVGIGTSQPTVKLDVRGEVNVGTDDAGHDVNFYGDEHDSRFFWDESKMALRAGRAEGSEWHDYNVGYYSFAAGIGTEASDEASIALGDSAVASGHASFAAGEGTEATGDYSTALGSFTDATGWASTALGSTTFATGGKSVAYGERTTAEGSMALAGGRQTFASGESSVALGYETMASGVRSFALGEYLRAGPARNTFVLGGGVSIHDSLVNNIEGSLMVGFNTTTPTLFVGGPDNRVGIGTDSPTSQLEVAGSIKMDPGVDNGCALRIAEGGDQKWALLYRPWANRVLTVFDDDGFKNVMSFELNTGQVGVNTTEPESMFDIDGYNGYSQLRLRESYTPASSADTLGNTGDIAWDDSYIYIKTSGGWKRATLGSF